LHQVVIHGAAGIGAAAAVADGGAVDQRGVALPQAFVVEAEALQALRPHVGDQHIRLAGKGERGLLAGRRLQIQHDAALVAVGLQKQRAHAGCAPWPDPAHGVAGLAFDLDDVRAQVAQDLRGRGAHDHGGEVEHAHASQGSGGRIAGQRPLRVGLLGAIWHRFLPKPSYASVLHFEIPNLLLR
jgi:hypothetical protein